MSFAELKREVRQLDRKKRRELAELLASLARADEEFWAEELARRHARMDAGEKYTIEDLQRRHDELVAQGK